MNDCKILDDRKLAALARKFREAAGKTQGEAARELKVSRPAIVQAENDPEKSFFSLRKRIIEKYSQFKLVGPAYWLEER
jgi:DNA-binding XRE family transcriptional regulator